jgi:anti-anti-sigma factor
LAKRFIPQLLQTPVTTAASAVVLQGRVATMTLASTDWPLYAQKVTPTSDAWYTVAAAGHEGDRTVISINGEFDLSNSDSLGALVDHAISSDDTNVEIDLSGAQFMSSATIHIFLEARESLGLRSRSLSLISPTPIGRRLLDLCGLTYRSDG